MSSHSGAVRTGGGFTPRRLDHTNQMVSGIEDFACDAYPQEKRFCLNHPGRVLSIYNRDSVCCACKEAELNGRKI